VTARRVAWIFASAAAAMIAATVAFAYGAARVLKLEDPPIKADAIIVLSGHFERAMHAADLYRAGYAPVVVLSEAVPSTGAKQLEEFGIRLPAPLEIERKILQVKGVPSEQVEVLGPPAVSTAAEATSIAARFGRPGVRLVVVTSPSHVLRAHLIIERALAGRGVTLAVCATPYESLPDEWWRSQDSAREVVLEWTKLVFYLLGGRFSTRAGGA
jgi:uncharacterized SAM-binding protein YcdF (DUF218 family)